MINKILDYLVVIFLVLIMILAASCTTPTEDEIFNEPQLSLNARLPIDENGYYHLILDSTKNQTVHRISGSVYPIFEPTKVEWESNLYWWLLEGQVVAEITKTYFNQFTGQLTYVNLPPLVNWKNVLVPTINKVSYVDSNNEINTMIAPIYSMRNDTLVVNAKVNEWDISQTIKIVLD